MGNYFKCEKLRETSGIDTNCCVQVPHEYKELEKKSIESEKIPKETFLNTHTEGRDKNDNICEIDQSATKSKVESLGNGKEKVYSNRLNFTQFNSSNLTETSYFTMNSGQLQRMTEI